MAEEAGSARRVFPLAAGLACLYVWLFITFPAFETMLLLDNGLGWYSLLRLLSSGLVTGVLVSALSGALRTRETRAWVIAAATCFRLTGQYLAGLAFAQGVLSGQLVVAYALIGCGLGVSLVFWGVLMCRDDVGENERAFIATFALAGCCLLAASFLPDAVSGALRYCLPVIEAALFVYLDDKSTDDAGVRTTTPLDSSQGSAVPLLLRTIVAISLVSIAWDVIADNAASSGIPEATAFACGMVLAAAVLWLFTKYSSSVGFLASVRWVLPVLAAGMAFGVFVTPAAAFLACLVTACAHTFFESILRLQVLRFARKSARDQMRAVGMGYSAIMLGSLVGTVAYRFAESMMAGHYFETVTCIMAVMVVIAVFAFPDSARSAEPDVEKGSLAMAELSADALPSVLPAQASRAEAGATPAQTPAQRISERFGLSVREAQVLAYLLQGRSRPYVRDELHISISTVDTHIRHIYEKTGVANRQELIDLAEAGSDEAGR